MHGSIWDMAIEQQKQKEASLSGMTEKHKETTLLVVGSKGVGKTTLIHRLLERQETSKPTLALEYTYGRKTNQTLAKVSIFWDPFEKVLMFWTGCLSYLGAGRRHVVNKPIGDPHVADQAGYIACGLDGRLVRATPALVHARDNDDSSDHSFATFA